MVKKIVGLGLFVALFVVVAGGVVMALWDRDVKAMLTPPASEYPLDWQQQIRALNSVPEEVRSLFAADSVAEGDAAGSLWSIADAGSWSAYERTYQAVSLGTEMSAADSAVFAGSLTDSILDVAVAASLMSDYSGSGVIGSADGVTLLSLRLPQFSPFRGIAFGLLTRSAAHLAADSQAAALADIGAVMRIGRMLYTESVFLVGNVTGRNMMLLGADQFGRFAAAIGDDSLGLRAVAIGSWARRRPDYASLSMALGSDVAATLAIVRDTDVLPCWRAEGISHLVVLNYRPRNIPLGIPGSALETVAGFKSLADPGVAWMAQVAENTIRGFNNLGIGERVEFLKGAAGP